MNKIVYNACYGGFGLSDKAYELYAELAGITLFPELIGMSTCASLRTVNSLQSLQLLRVLRGTVGVTYDQVFTQAPAQGIKYGWQKEGRYYKFGSDYSHYMDERFEEYSAEDGIPSEIVYDVTELYNWVKGENV